MANKFLTNVELDAGLVDGGNSTGTSGYLLSSTGTATSWVDPAAVSVGESEQVHIACKNTSGVAISKGDPVYITGTVGTSFIIQIAKADASVPTKMPAVGLAETDLGLNDEGFVIVSGVLKNLTTDPLSTSDGTPSSNDTVYVKAGGGLTKTKPTGSGNLIQNVGKVGRVSSANSGSLAVSTIMRTNDVPNLTTGKIWVGSSTYTTESTVVHLDETNGRMGIGTASPNDLFEIKSTTIPSIRLNSTDTTFPTFGSIKAYNNTTYRGELSWANNPVQAGAKITYIGFPSGSQKTGTFEVGADFVDTTINNGSMVTRLTTTGLGIGTTSPTATLQVDGSGLGAKIHSQQTTGLEVSGGGNSQDIARFQNVSGTTKVTIDTGGNVGIGITSPAQKLHVDGSIRVGDTNDVVYADKFFAVSNANLHIGANNGYDTVFFNGPNDERMRITSTGNVGIGTTSPAYKLDVDGEVRVGDNQKLKLWDDPFGAIITPLDAHLALTTTRTQDNIYFDPGNSTKMVIEGGGNVGIGTTSPGQKLHVAGNVEIDGEIHINNTSTKILEGSNNSVRVQTAGGYVEIGPHNASYSHFYTDRGKFYFNAPIIVDSGIFAAYNEAMQLQAPYGSTRMYINNSSGNVGIGTTSPGVKLDVAGDVRVDGLDNFLYTTNTNDIYTFGSSTQTMANAPNGYLWHDLLAFNYVYTTTQEVTSDGTNWSSTTLQKDLFAQKEGQAITVIGSTQTGVRWTFNNTAWGSAVLLNVAFTYVASDINKNILVESSSNGTSWTTRFTNTATAGTSTKTCKLTSYGGDAYVRVTITKAVSSSNLVRMSQLRLMTLRAGDQGYGREYHLPITWDGDRNIGIKLASPTTSISEALEVNGSVKATADTDAYKGYIKSVITTGYSMKSASTAYQYIPYNSYTLTTLQAYYNRTVAAYNGRVKKIIVKRIDGASADATGMKFKKEVNGTVSATEYTATVLSGSGNFQATYNFGNNDFTFSAGDSIGVLMQSSGGTGMIGAGAIQIVLEYNIT